MLMPILLASCSKEYCNNPDVFIRFNNSANHARVIEINYKDQLIYSDTINGSSFALTEINVPNDAMVDVVTYPMNVQLVRPQPIFIQQERTYILLSCKVNRIELFN